MSDDRFDNITDTGEKKDRTDLPIGIAMMAGFGLGVLFCLILDLIAKWLTR